MAKKVWMCEYCEEIFSTEYDAEYHEEDCDKNPKNNLLELDEDED